MPYKLILSKASEEPTRGTVDKIFLDNLSSEYRVYIFYCPGPVRNYKLESNLRDFGDKSGKNLLVTILYTNDEKYPLIASTFNFKRFPVVVITANDTLASIRLESTSSTAYVKLDNRHLLQNTDKTVEALGHLFNLYVQGKIAEALNQGNKYEKHADLSYVKDTINGMLKGIEVTVSILGGIFQITFKDRG